jgi:hypothetical protein
MLRRILVCLVAVCVAPNGVAFAITVQRIGRAVYAGDASTLAYQYAKANGDPGTGPVIVLARVGSKWTRSSFTPTSECTFVTAALARVLVDCPDVSPDASGPAERPWFFDPASNRLTEAPFADNLVAYEHSFSSYGANSIGFGRALLSAGAAEDKSGLSFVLNLHDGAISDGPFASLHTVQSLDDPRGRVPLCRPLIHPWYGVHTRTYLDVEYERPWMAYTVSGGYMGPHHVWTRQITLRHCGTRRRIHLSSTSEGSVLLGSRYVAWETWNYANPFRHPYLHVRMLSSRRTFGFRVPGCFPGLGGGGRYLLVGRNGGPICLVDLGPQLDSP